MEYLNLVFEEVYKILFLLVPVLVSVAMIVWLDRRVWAFVQKRQGPNVVGPFGLLQTLADALKYVFKEIIIPASSNKIIFILAPIITMTLALIAWAVIPFGEDQVLANINVGIFFTIYLSLINSPSMIFEIFPFILLITTQLFFIKLFNNDEIKIFKYSGLKNSRILTIITLFTLLIGLFTISIFYNASSNLKNFYLELKSNYTEDGKYLAVINKNGLWIRDKVDNKILIVNSSKIDDNFLINNFITEFDSNYDVIRNIKSEKIDIKNNEWVIYNPEIYVKNNKQETNKIIIYSNFDNKRINSLFSNLSSLSFLEGVFNKSKSGNLNLVVFLLLFSAFMKGKSS